MKKIKFTKMHGAGNDFVFLSRDKFKGTVTPKLAQRLLDRHFGIGGDQLLVLTANNGGAPRLDFYNSDGSMAEMCGNGTRAAAAYLRESKGFKKDFSIKTRTRMIGIRLTGRAVEVDMGEPVLEGKKIPVKASGEVENYLLRFPHPKSLSTKWRGTKGEARIHCVSMGNPHCVIFVKNVDKFPVREIGPLIENHPFFPRRVNVEFVELKSRSHVKARVWERGAGETLACGTGACAIGVAAARAGKTGRSIKIDLPGGQLGVRWGEDNHVYLTGPTETTYSGEFLLK